MMLNIQYAPTFIRLYKGLEPALKEEVKEKIALFQDAKNHPRLKVHKLKGRLEDTYSFSLNYKIRILFEYSSAKAVSLLYVGNHDGTYGK